jgi:hypothetical protein
MEKYCTAALTSSSVLGGPRTLIGFVRWRSQAQGHQRTKARCVIVVMVRNKNYSDLSEINTSLPKTACDTVTGINDIMQPVDG